MWPCEGGFVKIFFFQDWIWFFFTKQYFFSYTNYLISGFQKDHVGRIENEQLFRDQKLCIWRTMVYWCDWFSYQLDLHLPQQKETWKGRREQERTSLFLTVLVGDRVEERAGSLWTQTRAGKAIPGLASHQLLRKTVCRNTTDEEKDWQRQTRATGGGSRNTDVMWGACLIRGNTEIWHHGNPIILHTHN